MKLVSLVVYKNQDADPIELSFLESLSFVVFMWRGQFRDNLRFQSHVMAGRTPCNTIKSVSFDELGLACRSFSDPRGLSVVLTSDTEYPSAAATALLQKAVEVFWTNLRGQWEEASSDLRLECPALSDLFSRGQDPLEVDKLAKIHHDLELIKEDVHKSMNELLARGENLENLLQKSDKLRDVSKEFRRQAEKNNSWCHWLRSLLISSS